MSLIATLLNDSVGIERRTRIQDSTGSWVPGPKVTITVNRATVMSPYGVTLGSSMEESSASLTVTTKRILVAPVGTEIRPDDVVIHRDRRYAVVGEELELPLTSLAHMEVQVEEVTG